VLWRAVRRHANKDVTLRADAFTLNNSGPAARRLRQKSTAVI